MKKYKKLIMKLPLYVKLKKLTEGEGEEEEEEEEDGEEEEEKQEENDYQL